MARWQEVVESAPDLARRVQEIFESGRHKLLATLRRDGSPRIGGIECEFKDGDLLFGVMNGSVKAQDLKRDPRIAIHGPSPDPPEDPTTWQGDAKLSGRAYGVGGPKAEQPGTLFLVDISEVVLTRVGGMDHLLIGSNTGPAPAA